MSVVNIAQAKTSSRDKAYWKTQGIDEVAVQAAMSYPRLEFDNEEIAERIAAVVESSVREVYEETMQEGLAGSKLFPTVEKNVSESISILAEIAGKAVFGATVQNEAHRRAIMAAGILPGVPESFVYDKPGSNGSKTTKLTESVGF